MRLMGVQDIIDIIHIKIFRADRISIDRISIVVIIIDKIIPKSQFACRNDVNISDELVDLRNINLFLLGDKENKDGSILSIDYKNAFRTISLKWFNLVMRRLNFPDKFYRWFWNLYSSLGIKININNYSSNYQIN